MVAQIIDGKLMAQQVRQEAADEVAKMIAAGLPRPGLATVLVGENPASQVYVKSKIKACGEIGIESFGHHLPATASQQEVEDTGCTAKRRPSCKRYPGPTAITSMDWMKKRCCAPLALKKMWMVSIRLISGVWRKKVVILCLSPAPLMDALSCLTV